jgi:hypothetical protein
MRKEWKNRTWHERIMLVLFGTGWVATSASGALAFLFTVTIAAVFLMGVFAANTANAGPLDGLYHLSAGRVSTHTDNTPTTGAMTYRAIWSTDQRMLTDVNTATYYDLPPDTDNSAPIWDLDTNAMGLGIMDRVYVSTQACETGGTCSMWSPAYAWDVGHSDNSAATGIIIRKINPASSPDTYIVSIPPQTAPAAGYKLYFSDNSYRQVFNGPVLDFGNKSNLCFSTSNKGFYGAVVSYDNTGRMSGFDKLIYLLKGGIKCDDPKNCRVDGVHSAFPFGLHLGKYAEPYPDISACDSNLPLTPLTAEQQEIQNADMDNDLRVGPGDAFQLGLEYTNATQ